MYTYNIWLVVLFILASNIWEFSEWLNYSNKLKLCKTCFRGQVAQSPLTITDVDLRLRISVRCESIKGCRYRLTSLMKTKRSMLLYKPKQRPARMMNMNSQLNRIVIMDLIDRWLIVGESSHNVRVQYLNCPKLKIFLFSIRLQGLISTVRRLTIHHLLHLPQLSFHYLFIQLISSLSIRLQSVRSF